MKRTILLLSIIYNTISLTSSTQNPPKGWPTSIRYVPGTIIPPQCTNNIEIKWINNTLGYGVFATQLITANSIIGQYTGYAKVMHCSDVAKKQYAMTIAAYDPNTKTFDYMDQAGDYQRIIDAEESGNETRFINRSNNPNITAVKDINISLTQIFYVAEQDIQPGQQLTVNYGDAYWADKEVKPL